MIKTRLTDKFNLKAPIISAPMALAAGGRLASAVGRAGGLGLIGGGYGDASWIDAEFAEAGNAAVGCGFITWKLREHPEVLDQVIARAPQAIFLSFGSVAPYVEVIHAAGIPVIAQVQTIQDARIAVEAGADVIVAQGAEAGGHGEDRATFTLVPEIGNWLANNAPDVLLVAAGGVADGRGLAAALMLGADGVLVGSRFWASEESLVHPNMVEAAIAATGDDTIRSSVMDVARKLKWPERYTARVLKNAFTDQWHGNLDGLIAHSEVEAVRWREAWEAGDVHVANTFVGEAAGLINNRPPAAEILTEMARDGEALLRGQNASWRFE
ncbi:NAD(P)H-dependent flavin oxidoreductase [Cochlodiniinecator piscidefendens]|uniref:NAD(P)H-dependent flavin oxidoreductase n=1 Tax=Cochlodiniinecator piscidefendens TaxID=2715756 RepID=UPI001408C6AA|nr:nitronate monooxygenase [Cochlodiniinecator piscidefendens]